jgi:saccharopine dehydrogenase (NAD+, L-lysine-forming)
MTISKVAVLGLGKVGHLAAELLDGAGFAVTAFDNRARSTRASRASRTGSACIIST